MEEDKIIKKKRDLLKNFNDLFSPKGKKEDDGIPEDKRVCFLDSANSMGIIPKSNIIKNFIIENYDVKECKIPTLGYNFLFIANADKDKIMVSERIQGNNSMEEKENKVLISVEYMKVLANLCSKTDNKSIIIKSRRDYPLWVETDELICIIAPRIMEQA